MSNITKVVFTDLFWETLGTHRKHPRYQDFRRVIGACVMHKVDNRSFMSNSDKPFTCDPLKGIWHCKISRSPDVVLFYRMANDTIYLCMVGDHHDYRFNNKGANAGQITVDRIANAIERGNQPLPDWESLRWSNPGELRDNCDLTELSMKALRNLDQEIDDEIDNLALLQRAAGAERMNDPAVYGPWFDDLEAVKTQISEILINRSSKLKNERISTPVDALTLR
jgi:hypothetical protein